MAEGECSTGKESEDGENKIKIIVLNFIVLSLLSWFMITITLSWEKDISCLLRS